MKQKKLSSDVFVRILAGMSAILLLFSSNNIVAQNIDSVGALEVSGPAEAVIVSGNYAFLATNNSFKIINVSDPSNPAITGTCALDLVTIRGISIIGTYAFISNGIASLAKIIDISNPANPTLVNDLPASNQETGIDIRADGSYAYAIGNQPVFDISNGYLSVYNITNLSSPILATRRYVMDVLRGIFVSGGYAYMVGYMGNVMLGELRIFDLNNPSNPSAVGTFYPLAMNSDVFVSGNYAYVACSDLQIIDISDCTNPVLAGTYDTPVDTRNVFVRGSYVCIADDTAGVYIVNIVDPTAPSFAGRYQTRGPARDICKDESYVYVAEGSRLLILRFNPTGLEDHGGLMPANMIMHNYPNPFNAQTTISYHLPEASPVSLSIYNILGQKVATLVDGIQQAGEHKVVWDAAKIASGLYFGKLVTVSKNKNTKMMLLR